MQHDISRTAAEVVPLRRPHRGSSSICCFGGPCTHIRSSASPSRAASARAMSTSMPSPAFDRRKVLVLGDRIRPGAAAVQAFRRDLWRRHRDSRQKRDHGKARYTTRKSVREGTAIGVPGRLILFTVPISADGPQALPATARLELRHVHPTVANRAVRTRITKISSPSPALGKIPKVRQCRPRSPPARDTAHSSDCRPSCRSVSQLLRPDRIDFHPLVADWLKSLRVDRLWRYVTVGKGDRRARG